MPNLLLHLLLIAVLTATSDTSADFRHVIMVREVLPGMTTIGDETNAIPAIRDAGAGVPAIASAGVLTWTIVQMRAASAVTVDQTLLEAFEAASSPHSICGLRSLVAAPPAHRR